MEVDPEATRELLSAHCAVSGAAVTRVNLPGIPRALVALVALRDPEAVDMDQLRALCERELPGYQVPELVVLGTPDQLALGPEGEPGSYPNLPG